MLVSSNQSAFIPGRNIQDNILLTQEIMKGYNRNGEGGGGGQKRVAIKIDLQKAYDTINWKFLEKSQVEFGFHEKMVHWIMQCVTTAGFTINVNGERVGYFKGGGGGRGLRQGDLVSPYLFTLIMEVFSLMLQRQIEKDSSFSYHFGCKSIKLVHVSFADDLLVMCHGDLNYVKVIKRALDEFNACSGLLPNNSKSTMFFGSLNKDEKNAILSVLPFATGKLPVRYLGVPLIAKRLSVKDCGCLLDKIKRKVKNWKNRSLSYADRLQLIAVVLESIHVYWASVFLIPTTIINEINSLLKWFLWNQRETAADNIEKDSSFSYHFGCKSIKLVHVSFADDLLVMWHGDSNYVKVIKRALDEFNACSWLLPNNSKSTMFFGSLNKDEKNAILSVLPFATGKLPVRPKEQGGLGLKNLHVWNQALLAKHEISVDPNDSWGWKNLLGVRDIIKYKVRSIPGNRKTTSLWYDNWCSRSPLSSIISHRDLYDARLNSNMTVRDMICDSQWRWPVEWYDKFPSITSLTICNLNDGVKDSIVWRTSDERDMKFFVRFANTEMNIQALVVPWWKNIWNKICSIAEIHDNNLGLMDSIQVLLDAGVGNNIKRIIKRLMLAASIYNIWKERNGRIFKDT
ncbi:RNA-directed DNA polymerase, eukaryota, reverse transcriptase zinc-binding domain protein [Tanacetum coccineum]|uniref:RNA-directed DNA polymerase, eukaryota, reverse transcriptase zinc-binding domain protein n=1 Tax=Tanacetum coccineum TaxID=301880 RepID=A0ABQ5AE29_9ASTR